MELRSNSAGKENMAMSSVAILSAIQQSDAISAKREQKVAKKNETHAFKDIPCEAGV